MSKYNPIASVDGVEIPCPSSYQYMIQDISSPDAGRLENTVMDKMMVGQCVKIELGWNNTSSEVVSQVLKAFNQRVFHSSILRCNARWLSVIRVLHW